MPIYAGPFDPTNPSKPAGQNVLNPDGTVQAQAKQAPEGAAFASFGRTEPILDAQLLKERFLAGIPMQLRIINPETKKPFRITDEQLQDYIELAIDEAEGETGLTIMPVQYVEKLPFQKQDFEQFGYFQLPRRPVSSIERLAVQLADGSDVFEFPTQWIETAHLIHGQLNIIPLAFQGIEGGTGIIGGGINAGGGTAVFFNSLWNRPWVAALFGMTYTAGFLDALVPRMVNNLIGTIAAMRVLSQIAAAYAIVTSTSLGLDGMSQSVSTPGPQRFAVRIEELKADRKLYVKKLKKMFGTAFVVGTV